MQSSELQIDVAAITAISGAKVAGSLHLPDTRDRADPLELLVCVHGGGYTRRYWHPMFAAFPGYSFAEYMTERGYGVFAFDLLGMGESSQPEPESVLNRTKIAAASEYATRAAVEKLDSDRVVLTGIGHSIGAMMAITQQAAHRTFDRLAVLGWANQPMVLGDVSPETLANSLQAGYQPRPGGGVLRALFYAPDVPVALIEADEAIGTTTPYCLARDALVPGIVHAAAAAITCPVFVMHGEIDTSPNPHAEVPFFKGSHDVSLMVLEASAHCHNFATLRHRLWDRLDGWIGSLPLRPSVAR
jgi:pimeloyl-ACP methyl ester carboxylesterase